MSECHRVLIVGAGAIGLCLARHFIELQRASVAMIEENESKEPLVLTRGRDGPTAFDIRETGDANTQHYELSTTSWNAMPEPGSVDVAFVCVKSTALAGLHWGKLAALGCAVAVLCNGYVDDILDDVRERFDFPGMLLEQAAVLFGAKRATDGAIVESKEPRRVVLSGYWSSIVPHLASSASGTIDFVCANDFATVLAKKWVVNAAANSLCAKYDLSTNGELFEHRAELDELIDEAIELAKILYPEVDEGQLSRKMVDEVIEHTRHNMNSMVADLRRQRRTESSFLAGIAVNFAQFPKLAAIHRAIEAQGG